MHLEMVDPQKRVEVYVTLSSLYASSVHSFIHTRTILTTTTTKTEPMTSEQKEIMKEYTRGMQRRHNRENALLSRKRVLQRRAVDALPKQFSDAANTVDETPFSRFIPFPPVRHPKRFGVHPQHAVF